MKFSGALMRADQRRQGIRIVLGPYSGLHTFFRSRIISGDAQDIRPAVSTANNPDTLAGVDPRASARR